LRFTARCLEIAHDRANPIQAFQDQRNRVGRYFKLAITYLAKHVLASMSDRFQPRQAKKTTGALDGVNKSENVAKQFGIVGILLELDQLDIENREILGGFRQEFTEQIVHTLDPVIGCLRLSVVRGSKDQVFPLVSFDQRCKKGLI